MQKRVVCSATVWAICILPSTFRRVVPFDEALEAAIVLGTKDGTSVNHHSGERVAFFQAMCRFVVAQRALDSCLSQQGFSGVIQNSWATTRTVITASAGLTAAVGLVARWFAATTGAARCGNLSTTKFFRSCDDLAMSPPTPPNLARPVGLGTQTRIHLGYSHLVYFTSFHHGNRVSPIYLC